MRKMGYFAKLSTCRSWFNRYRYTVNAWRSTQFYSRGKSINGSKITHNYFSAKKSHEDRYCLLSKAASYSTEREICETVSELALEPTPKQTPEPAPELAPEPTPEPAPKLTPEPVPDLVPEVAPEPAPEAAPEPTPEPAPELAPEAAPELDSDSDSDSHSFSDSDSDSYSNSNSNTDAESASSDYKQKKINPETFGVGGLGPEFADIVRRTIISRSLPLHIRNKLAVKNVVGILLHGPPGNGKTLIARQLGKLLGGREPKIVNGPDLISRYHGDSEKNVRELFKPAQREQAAKGDKSGLHVIIFDEIDAICPVRGAYLHADTIVNQLLTMIDGVNTLNNILLIGTTNRKELIDTALLRPGRFEVHLEIGLPDAKGRLEILEIYTKTMRENGLLCEDVNLQKIAAQTENFSGAAVEGLVKSASSYALNRALAANDEYYEVNEDAIALTMKDFTDALNEVNPVFRASMDTLRRSRPNGMLDCGARHEHIMKKSMLLAEQVRVNNAGSLLVTCLLQGPRGSGKSAIAATVGIDSGFPFVKTISADSMIGLSESKKCKMILEAFEDAYRSPLSMIILEDIERLLEYVAAGPQFSNMMLQTLMLLLNRPPPKGKKLLVMGLTSEAKFLNSVGMNDAFSVQHHVPPLTTQDAKTVLKQLNVFSDCDIDAAAEALNNVPIKKVYRVIEMAAQGPNGGGTEAVYSGKAKIDIWHFYESLRQIV